MIHIIAVSGHKNSGKTSLCKKLLAELQKLNIRTGYIKRTEEDIISNAGTDTGLLMDLNVGTVLWGKDGIRSEAKSVEDTTPQAIAARYFPDAELLILEGGKNLSLPKIWVRSKEEDIPDYPGIFIVYDRESCGDGKYTYTEGEEAALAQRLSVLVRGASYRSANIYIGEIPLPMKNFVSDFISGSILGMLASLKGGSNDNKPVRIYLDGTTSCKK